MLAIQFTALGQLVVQTLEHEWTFSPTVGQYLQWFSGFGAVGWFFFNVYFCNVLRKHESSGILNKLGKY
jgi:hypothetical protein